MAIDNANRTKTKINEPNAGFNFSFILFSFEQNTAYYNRNDFVPLSHPVVHLINNTLFSLTASKIEEKKQTKQTSVNGEFNSLLIY